MIRQTLKIIASVIYLGSILAPFVHFLRPDVPYYQAMAVAGSLAVGLFEAGRVAIQLERDDA